MRDAELRQALYLQRIPVVSTQHRIKHVAGVWKRMNKKDLSFEQVHDLIALRVIVPTETDCYHALGVVQESFRPIVGRFKDYIAAPKANGYRSQHLSVRDREGRIFEIQIRSVAMHQHAEHGDAAHVNYNETQDPSSNFGGATTWRRVLAWFGIPWGRDIA